MEIFIVVFFHPVNEMRKPHHFFLSYFQQKTTEWFILFLHYLIFKSLYNLVSEHILSKWKAKTFPFETIEMEWFIFSGVYSLQRYFSEVCLRIQHHLRNCFQGGAQLAQQGKLKILYTNPVFRDIKQEFTCG